MVAPLLVAFAVCAGGYYLTRLAPRVAARAAGAAVASSSLPPHLQYQLYQDSGFQRQLTEREALLILGFPEQSTKLFQRPTDDEIRARYREVIRELHSDVNGSPFVASKINEAKDYLIKK